jgi:hypothetical protein
MIAPIAPAFEFVYDGCVSSIYHANRGEGLPKHVHTYAHAVYVASGEILIRKQNIEKNADKHTQPLNLKEGEWHEIEALENGTVFVTVFSEEKTKIFAPAG